MSSNKPTYRTVLELVIISAVLYVLFGTPGLPSSLKFHSNDDQDVATSHTRIEQLVTPSKDIECPEDSYSIHIYSTSPLVLYIENFLSHAEADHLIAQSADKWQPSTVFNGGAEVADTRVRKSEKAQLARDNTVQCVERRALALQGWPAHAHVERLWTQRYNASGHYALHYDWAAGSRRARRLSSFMVYLDAACDGGGTHFPRLPAPGGGGGGDTGSSGEDSQWCEFVECGPWRDGDGSSGSSSKESGGGGGGGGGGDVSSGVVFRPRKGAAVFWRNFDADGKGYRETIHAGLPVTRGTKIGLNIWTWYQAGYVEPGEL